MIDYVIYQDTDSMFCDVDLIMKANGLTEKLDSINDNEKVDIIVEISKEIRIRNPRKVQNNLFRIYLNSLRLKV